MIARRVALGLLAVSGTFAAMGASGCQPGQQGDSKSFSGEQARVSTAISNLYDAYQDEQNDRNGAVTACRELLSARLVKALDARGGCAKVTKAALKDSDPVQPDVEAVTVNGDRATAKVVVKVTADRERTDTLTLVREGANRAWHLDNSTSSAVRKS